MPDPFYSTPEWQKLRAKTRARWKRDGRPCSFCHQPLDWSKPRGVVVDHTKNRKQFPHLALDPSNLTCVCHPCNSKKASWVENNSKVETNASGFPVGSEWC